MILKDSFRMQNYLTDLMQQMIVFLSKTDHVMKTRKIHQYSKGMPEKEDVSGCALMIAAGFATFENVCYLTQNGAASLLHLLIRGFGTGAMHVTNGALTAAGLMALAISYHGIYNLLVSQTGAAAVIGCLIPGVTAAAGWLIGRRLGRNEILQREASSFRGE